MSDGAVIDGVLYVITGRKPARCRCECGDCWKRDADRPDPRDLCAECLRDEQCPCHVGGDA